MKQRSYTLLLALHCLLVVAFGTIAQGPFVEKLPAEQAAKIALMDESGDLLSAREINEVHRRLLHCWVFPKAFTGRLHLVYQGITRKTGELPELGLDSTVMIHRSNIEGSIGEPVSWSVIFSPSGDELVSIWVSVMKTPKTSGVMRINDRKLFVNIDRIFNDQKPDFPLDELNGETVKQLIERLEAEEK